MGNYKLAQSKLVWVYSTWDREGRKWILWNWVL